MAHKGKVTSDVTFNPEDPPEAYINQSVHSRLSNYTSMAREVNGPDFDSYTAPIDAEVVMRVGGGKKHGRYYIADRSTSSSHHSQSVVDSSQKHQLRPDDTLPPRQYRRSDGGTQGYFRFI